MLNFVFKISFEQNCSAIQLHIFHTDLKSEKKTPSHININEYCSLVKI